MKAQNNVTVQDQNTTCDNNMLDEVFEKKYIVAGLFDFGNTTDVYRIDLEKMVHTKLDMESFIEEIEDKSFDYVILPDFNPNFLPKTIGVVNKIERIKTICKDVGWGCC